MGGARLNLRDEAIVPVFEVRRIVTALGMTNNSLVCIIKLFDICLHNLAERC